MIRFDLQMFVAFSWPHKTSNSNTWRKNMQSTKKKKEVFNKALTEFKIQVSNSNFETHSHATQKDSVSEYKRQGGIYWMHNF